MGHPIQGWMVNSFGHAIGGRNFDTDDNSRNNLVVALLVMGEGLQNNHHQYPSSPRFAFRWFEPDFGWHLCRAMELFGIIKINRNKLMPSAREQARAAVV
jgi:stearoyl-CoA desaturase (delta-9 desaturase)